MKKAFVLIMLLIAVPLIMTMVSDDTYKYRQIALWSLQGGSINRSLAQEINEAGGLGTVMIDMFGSSKPVYNTVEPGTPGYGVDVMKMLQYIDPDSPEARYYYDAIELFYMAARGELCDSPVRLGVASYAHSWTNESSRGFWISPAQYRNAMGPYNDNQMSMQQMTGAMVKALGLSGSGAVWKDANGDGYADGPMQIEAGAPNSDNLKRVSTLSGTGHSASRTFDVYFMPDQLAWKNHDFNIRGASRFSGSDMTDTEAAMLAAVIHNRGSGDQQAWGIPYHPSRASTSSIPSLNSLVTTTNSETFEQMRRMFQDQIQAFNSVSPTIGGTDNPSMRALGASLLLRQGWYIQKGPGWANAFATPAGRSYLAQVFPETAGMDGAAVRSWLEANYVKDAWDVLGITESEFRRIYACESGGFSNYYSGSGAVQFYLFKAQAFTSSAYTRKLNNGRDPLAFQVWDEIVIGHVAGAAFLAEYNLLQIFVLAGLPAEIDGQLLDLSNPAEIFAMFKQKNPNTFQPQGPVTQTWESFQSLMNITGILPSPMRQQGLYAVYGMLGSYYHYGGGGRVVSVENFELHLSLAGTETRRSSLKKLQYQQIDGSGWGSTATNGTLAYYGTRLFDCASLAMVGPSMGQVSTSGVTMLFSDSTAGILQHARSGTTRSVSLNGQVYDATLRVVSTGEYTAREFVNNPSLVDGGLLPGDILVYRDDAAGKGHAVTFFGVAQTSGTIPWSIARGTMDVPFTAGDILVMEAWATGQVNRVRVFNSTQKFWVVRPNFYEDGSIYTTSSLVR